MLKNNIISRRRLAETLASCDTKEENKLLKQKSPQFPGCMHHHNQTPLQLPSKKQLNNLQNTCEEDWLYTSICLSYIFNETKRSQKVRTYYYVCTSKRTNKNIKKISFRTYFTVSSAQIASQRLNKDVFFRIPLNVFGGVGRSGREKVSISIEPNPCIWSSDESKSSSAICLNDSASFS